MENKALNVVKEIKSLLTEYNSMGENYMGAINIKNYKELRGTINNKRANIFKKNYLVVSDGKNQINFGVGKELFDMYVVGEQVTIGYVGKKLINIRKGICENED